MCYNLQLKVMAGSAILGGVILAMIEGVGVLTNKWMGAMVDPTAPPVSFPSFLGMEFEFCFLCLLLFCDVIQCTFIFQPEVLEDPRNLPPPKVEPGVDSTTPFGLPSALPNLS